MVLRDAGARAPHGRGAPYTGLKRAGYEPPTGITAADQALETGSIEGLASRLADHAGEALRERYERVKALSGYETADVEAGRAYVHVSVEYIHLVERLYGLINAGDR